MRSYGLRLLDSAHGGFTAESSGLASCLMATLGGASGCRVWAPRGRRPVAVGHHRFEWLHVTAFVSPATGESFRYLGTGVDKGLFEV